MKRFYLFSAIICFTFVSNAQLSPVITSWIINTTGATGYDGIPSNVQVVQYTGSAVYISCTCIPGYDIGPWNSDPNIPANQNFVFKLPLSPQKNTGTATVVGLGHCGVWSNGVSIFNASDGMSYNSDNTWHRNAYYFEGISFDSCLGHAQQTGEYHHHISPRCLYNEADSTHHSPIIGYGFDGFPVYGAYGYSDTTGTGGIRRMRSSWQLRNISTRDTLPDGTVLSSTNYGPAIGSSYPLGDFLEDYQYVPGSGDLDANNGRFCVTPEYPAGTYAYFVTIDSALNPVYPYVLGANYYGVVTTGNTGPGSGHNTIADSTTIYTPSTTGVKDVQKTIKFKLYPNPASDYVYIFFDPASDNNITGSLYNTKGQILQTIRSMQPGISYSLKLSGYAAGDYFLHLETGNSSLVQKIVKVD